MLLRTKRKGLAAALTALLVLGASGSASALTISIPAGLREAPYQLTVDDLSLAGWSYDAKDLDQYTSYLSGLLTRLRDGRTGANPVPEPSSALVFGLGLLAARRISRLVR